MVEAVSRFVPIVSGVEHPAHLSSRWWSNRVCSLRDYLGQEAFAWIHEGLQLDRLHLYRPVLLGVPRVVERHLAKRLQLVLLMQLSQVEISPSTLSATSYGSPITPASASLSPV